MYRLIYLAMYACEQIPYICKAGKAKKVLVSWTDGYQEDSRGYYDALPNFYHISEPTLIVCVLCQKNRVYCCSLVHARPDEAQMHFEIRQIMLLFRAYYFW